MIAKFSAGGRTFRFEGDTINNYLIDVTDSIAAPLSNDFKQSNVTAYLTDEDGKTLLSEKEKVTVLEIMDNEKMIGVVAMTNATVYIMEHGKTVDTIYCN